jgi:uncharacterized protein YjbJ (UPF0337 family)
VVAMSVADKFHNMTQGLRGRAKQKTGEATGNRRLQREGRADQVKGDLKQAGEKIKDAMRRRRTPR